MDFQRLFYINHEFENRTFDWVSLIFFLFGEFNFVRLPNSIELNPPIEFDFVRFRSIGFDLLCRAKIDFADFRQIQAAFWKINYSAFSHLLMPIYGQDMSKNDCLTVARFLQSFALKNLTRINWNTQLISSSYFFSKDGPKTGLKLLNRQVYGMVWYGNFIYTRYFLQVHLHSSIEKLST